IHGSAYRSAQTRLGRAGGGVLEGASTGVLLSSGLHALGLSWADEHRGGGARREVLRASIGTGLSTLSMHADLEAGTMTVDGEAPPYPVRHFNAQVRWTQARAGTWLTIGHRREGASGTAVHADLGARIRLGGLRL